MLVCDWRMQRQPMIDTFLERAHFGIQTAKSPIMFDNAGALVEEGLPIVTRPAGSVKAQQGENLCLVPSYGFEDIRGRSGSCLQEEMFTFDEEGYPCRPGSLEGQTRAHNRILQHAPGAER